MLPNVSVTYIGNYTTRLTFDVLSYDVFWKDFLNKIASMIKKEIRNHNSLSINNTNR